MQSRELSFVTCLPHGRLEWRNIIAAATGRLKQYPMKLKREGILSGFIVRVKTLTDGRMITR
jgi:hypothetical protein